MERIETSFRSGGVRCAAWLYQPEANGEVPIVVMAHGFTGTRRDRIGPFAERFAAAGIAALAFDYRGFGDSAGEPRDVVDVEAQLDDWRAALRFARGLPGVDPARVVAWGTSYGGGHAISIAAEDGELAAAIAQVPFVDTVKQFPKLRPGVAARVVRHATRDRWHQMLNLQPHVIPAVAQAGEVGFITAPGAADGWLRVVENGEQSTWRNRAAARTAFAKPYRPATVAPKIKCPLLVCVGDTDNVAPPSHAALVAEKAPRGELRRYPIGHFDIYMGEAFEAAVADQEEFLERHLL